MTVSSSSSGMHPPLGPPSCTALNSVTFKGSVPSECNFNTAFYGTAFLNDCKTSNWFDNFASPYPIAGASGSVLSDNYLATTQSGEPLSSVRNTKWLRWTAPKSGTVWFHTQGSKFDTLVGIYQGATFSSLTKVAENDDFMLDRTSQVSFEAVGGETYYVCVGGYSGNPCGEFKLAWRMGTPVTLTLDPNGGTFTTDVPSVVTVPKNAIDTALVLPRRFVVNTIGTLPSSGASPIFSNHSVSTTSSSLICTSSSLAQTAISLSPFSVTVQSNAPSVLASARIAWSNSTKICALLIQSPASGRSFMRRS